MKLEPDLDPEPEKLSEHGAWLTKYRTNTSLSRHIVQRMTQCQRNNTNVDWYLYL